MGLYDDDNASVTNGDVLDVIYWQTKFAHLKLDAALKSRQPEGAIRGLIPSVTSGAEDVLKRYPNHADVKAWLENARKIEGKVDPNASHADFKGDFDHWKDYSYEAGWRHYHVAKMAAAAQDWSVAGGHARDGLQQLNRSLERMAKWPADVQSFVKAAREELEKIKADSKPTRRADTRWVRVQGAETPSRRTQATSRASFRLTSNFKTGNPKDARENQSRAAAFEP
jgi:hypothetical protein